MEVVLLIVRTRLPPLCQVRIVTAHKLAFSHYLLLLFLSVRQLQLETNQLVRSLTRLMIHTTLRLGYCLTVVIVLRLLLAHR